MSNATPIVIRLQEMAADSKSPLPDLLRKALIIATKLGLEDFRTWVLNELNGYQNVDDLPSYRIIHGDLRALNPYHGLIPFLIQDPGIAKTVRKKHIFESVESLCHLLTTKDRNETLTYPYPPELESMLMQLQGEIIPLRPMLVIGHNQIAAIIEKVRTHLLDWALRLESEGILGDGLTFSEDERKKAEMSQNISIQNFQGVLGNVSGGTVSQNNELTIAPGNFSTLSDYLSKFGIAPIDISDLEAAIKADPPQPSKSNFGSSVSNWLGKMVSKSAEGSWSIGLSVAGNLLSTALAKYYGIG